MIEFKNYKNEVEKDLDLFIKTNKNENKIDIKIIKEIRFLIKNTMDFFVPYMSFRYKNYNKIKIEENIHNDIACSFEFDFDIESDDNKTNYAKIPSLIFKIPQNKLDKLSSIIGTEIKGDLIFLVRKYKNKWQIPIKGIYIDQNEVVKEIPIFKSLFFQLEIEKDEKFLKEANSFLTKLLKEKSIQFTNISFNKNIGLFVTEKNGFIPTCFIFGEEDEKIKNKSELYTDINSYFLLNLLYEKSIKL